MGVFLTSYKETTAALWPIATQLNMWVEPPQKMCQNARQYSTLGIHFCFELLGGYDECTLPQ